MPRKPMDPMSLPDVRSSTLAQLTPDVDNLNVGTERGVGMLEHSLQVLGAGRSLVIDKHGRIIAGNKTAEAAAAAGLHRVIVVPTDGTQLVAVQRLDLDLATDPRARELAIADNRTGEVGFSLDVDALKRAGAAGADLSAFYSDAELERLYSDDALPEAEPPASSASSMHTCPQCGHTWGGD